PRGRRGPRELPDRAPRRSRAPVGVRPRPPEWLRPRAPPRAIPRRHEACLRALVVPVPERDAQLLPLGSLGERLRARPRSARPDALSLDAPRPRRGALRGARGALVRRQGGRRGRGGPGPGEARSRVGLRPARAIRAGGGGRAALVPPPRLAGS